MNYDLPSNIKKILEGYTIQESPRGLSGAGIYMFKNGTNRYYLKVVDVNNRFINELETEYKILRWLEGKLPATQAICFEKSNRHHFLLITAVEGETLEELLEKGVSVEQIVRIYAESLKLIHSVDVQDCPTMADDETTIKNAKLYLESGHEPDGTEEESKGLTPWQLYDKLISLKPQTNEYVFTHGDYCFDNMLIKTNKLNGVIDIGRGGIGDKYKDIALAVRNIRSDLGEKWLDLFFEVYGIDNLNWDKIKFYIIMDEFY